MQSPNVDEYLNNDAIRPLVLVSFYLRFQLLHFGVTAC